MIGTIDSEVRLFGVRRARELCRSGLELTLSFSSSSSSTRRDHIRVGRFKLMNSLSQFFVGRAGDVSSQSDVVALNLSACSGTSRDICGQILRQLLSLAFSTGYQLEQYASTNPSFKLYKADPRIPQCNTAYLAEDKMPLYGMLMG